MLCFSWYCRRAGITRGAALLQYKLNDLLSAASSKNATVIKGKGMISDKKDFSKTSVITKHCSDYVDKAHPKLTIAQMKAEIKDVNPNFDFQEKKKL